MINAKEAKQIAVDARKAALDLSNEAVAMVVKELDSKITESSRAGALETSVSLYPIKRLNFINIEAAKLATMHLADKIRSAGYDFDTFTNHDSTLNIRWNR